MSGDQTDLVAAEPQEEVLSRRGSVPSPTRTAGLKRKGGLSGPWVTPPVRSVDGVVLVTGDRSLRTADMQRWGGHQDAEKVPSGDFRDSR